MKFVHPHRLDGLGDIGALQDRIDFDCGRSFRRVKAEPLSTRPVRWFARATDERIEELAQRAAAELPLFTE